MDDGGSVGGGPIAAQGGAPQQRSSSVASPRVSVVLPTRNRPEDVSRCVATLLRSDHDSFEVIVIDQSETSTKPHVDDARLTWISSPTVGKSVALNEALRIARAEILAFVDDDCTVPPTWLSDIDALFAANCDIDMMFGNLDQVQHDDQKAFVPAADLGRFEIVRGRGRAWLRGGAGANLAIRRSVLTTVNGFDEMIGPGSRFRACEEFDLYFRTLAAGFAVARVPEIAVLHWGARPYSDGSGQALLNAYAYGEGVVVGKHLRLGDLGMANTGLHILVDDTRTIVRQVVSGGVRGSGITRLIYKLRGAARGLVTRVDRRARMFRS